MIEGIFLNQVLACLSPAEHTEMQLPAWQNFIGPTYPTVYKINHGLTHAATLLEMMIAWRRGTVLHVSISSTKKQTSD